MKIFSEYKKGSDGCINVVVRKKGIVVEYMLNDEVESFVQEKNEIIVGWEAEVGFMSGYTEYSFDNEKEAIDFAEEQAK